MAACEEGSVSRRNFFSNSAAAAVAVGVGVTDPLPSLALNFGNYQKQMANFGLPAPSSIPDGLSPVLEFYGKAVPGQVPLLVTFFSPSTWILQRPSIDKNGEDGTISTGDYGKGDSASLFVAPPLKEGESLTAMDKQYFADLVFAGSTQKGVNLLQNFKLIKFSVAEDSTDEQPAVNVEYSYDLLTGAGFEVSRRGVGRVTSVGGKSTQALLVQTTSNRWKKLEPTLRNVAKSFKVYTVKPALVPITAV